MCGPAGDAAINLYPIIENRVHLARLFSPELLQQELEHEEDKQRSQILAVVRPLCSNMLILTVCLDRAQ